MAQQAYNREKESKKEIKTEKPKKVKINGLGFGCADGNGW